MKLKDFEIKKTTRTLKIGPFKWKWVKKEYFQTTPNTGSGTTWRTF